MKADREKEEYRFRSMITRAQEDQELNKRRQRNLQEQQEEIYIVAQKEQRLYAETISYAEEGERGYFQESMDESQWLSRKIQEELSKQQEALQGDYRNLVKQEEELLFQRQKRWQGEESNES